MIINENKKTWGNVMRKLIIGGLVALAAVVVYAAESPFPPWLQKYIDQPVNKNGKNLQRVARAVYDVSLHGGSIAAHGLGVSLPKKAIILRDWFVVDTQFTDGGTGTVALSCEDANNIKTATDITGSSAGAFVEGASTGAASAFVDSIAEGCEITATVAGAAQSTGKLTVFVEYVNAD